MRIGEILEATVNELIRDGWSYTASQREFKRAFILHALTICKGNESATALMMDVHRNTLLRQMAEVGINAKEVKQICRSGLCHGFAKDMAVLKESDAELRAFVREATKPSPYFKSFRAQEKN